MRAQLVVAVGLVAGLEVAAPLLEPATLSPAEAATHLGETVRIEGTVQRIDPGPSVTAVDVHADGAHVRVLLRDRPPPPLGALVRVTGDLAPGDRGPVLWPAQDPEIIAAPEPAPLALADLLDRAPELAGQPVATVARWDPGSDRILGAGGTLHARWLATQPGEDPVHLWGQLVYDTEHARYRLDATGWRPWIPPPG